MSLREIAETFSINEKTHISKILQVNPEIRTTTAALEAEALNQCKLQNHEKAKLLLELVISRKLPKALNLDEVIQLSRCYIETGDTPKAQKLLFDTLKVFSTPSRTERIYRTLAATYRNEKDSLNPLALTICAVHTRVIEVKTEIEIIEKAEDMSAKFRGKATVAQCEHNTKNGNPITNANYKTKLAAMNNAIKPLTLLRKLHHKIPKSLSMREAENLCEKLSDHFKIASTVNHDAIIELIKKVCFTSNRPEPILLDMRH